MKPTTNSLLGIFPIDVIFIDVEGLLSDAQKCGYPPIYLTVGKSVLETITVEKIKQELNLESWSELVNFDPVMASEVFKRGYKQTYQDILNMPKGFELNGITTYFLPEEPYISLYVVNTTRLAKNEPSTKDGYPVEVLLYDLDSNQVEADC